MSALKMQDIPARQVKTVEQMLMNAQARDQLASVATRHLSPERMMRVVANAIRATPKLKECDPMSFLGAMMHCSAIGLEPNTLLGHAYLIPFENKRKGITEVQVVIGYKGYIELARRTGRLASIHADIVLSDDAVWSHEYGSNAHLRHVYGPRKGSIVGAYCHIKLILGEDATAEGHRFMTLDEIISHRNTFSQGWKTAVKFGKTKDSPWNENGPSFRAMAMKTAVRSLANRGELPMSIEFMEALAADDTPADFRAFAMDPTAGLAPLNDDFIEGEVEDDPKQVSDDRARQVRLNESNTRSPEPEPVSSNASKPMDGRPVRHQQKDAPVGMERASEQPSKQGSMFDHVTANVAAIDVYAHAFGATFIEDVKTMGLDEALTFHGSQVDQIKEADPDFHSAIMLEANRIESETE